MTNRAAAGRTCMTALLTFHLSGLGELMARCHSCSALSPSWAERCGLPEASQACLAQTSHKSCCGEKKGPRPAWRAKAPGWSMNEEATMMVATALPVLQHT